MLAPQEEVNLQYGQIAVQGTNNLTVLGGGLTFVNIIVSSENIFTT